MPRFLASPFQLPRRRQLKTIPNTTIEIENKLLHINELLNARIFCRQSVSPPDRLTIFSHYLKHVYKSQTEIALKWKRSEDGWQTEFSFHPGGVGNYLIRFSNGTRDKINPYTRYFCVIDDKTTVCTFNHILDTPMANYHNFYHRYYIPADFEIVFNRIFGKIESNPKWIGHNIYRYYAYKYGDSFFPRIDPRYLPDLRGNDAAKNDNELNAKLEAFIDAWKNIFLYPEPEVLGVEAFNQELLAAAKECGISAISGLIADRNQLQTSGMYETLGLPLFPHYLEGKQSDNRMVSFPITSHPLLSHDFSAYQLSPAVAKTHGYATAENMQFLYDFLNEQILNRDLRTPNFLNIELKSHFLPEVAEMNMLIMRYLLRFARKEKLVFAHKEEIVKYYKRHFSKTPERAFYITDMYQHPVILCSSARHKPPKAHNCIYFENNESRVCFRRAEMLPYYYYVYSESNVMAMTKYEHSDLSSLQIKCYRSFEPTYKLNIQIRSEHSFEQFPLAFWDIPFFLEEVKNELQHNFSRFIPVIGPEFRNFNAIGIVNIKAGENSYSLDFGKKLKRV